MSDSSQLNGPNLAYLADLYDEFVRDPSRIDPATRSLLTANAAVLNGSTASPGATVAGPGADKVIGAVSLAQAIRFHGHLVAQLDPLGGSPPGDPALDVGFHGLTNEDLEQLPASVVGGAFGQTMPNAAVAIEALRTIYSATTGYDFDQVQNSVERAWLRDAVEGGRYVLPDDTQLWLQILKRLTETESFERYLHRTFPGQKRFSIEGLDVLLPVLDEIVARTAEAGGKEVVFGMAHRGRLSVLTHILGKPYEEIIAKFHDPSHRDEIATSDGSDAGYAGDVKYHLGHRSAYHREGNGQVVDMQLTLAPNPSHLEFVNPVVMGMDRASDDDRSAAGAPIQNARAALAVLIHGDAAFPGQGVVAETLNLSRLRGYDIGGAIHIITNNQVGFTTDTIDARSTLYASDLAKGFEVPIIHVNADDVAACLAAARLAHGYRTQFGKDVLIDVIGYRRWGHNEGDEPAYTQPGMYDVIGRHPTLRAIWAARLTDAGIISGADADQMVEASMAEFQKIRSSLGDYRRTHHVEVVRRSIESDDPNLVTAVAADRLRELNRQLSSYPQGFTIHPKLEKILRRRDTALDEDAIDWGHAEALAFASILADGTPIRMSGQDIERGTFSHRHAVLHDARDGARWVPLQQLEAAEASFAIYNSPLSETAVLGFEYGYSIQAPEALVLWEAQFGDFSNGAQVIIDQFIAGSRAKWQIDPSLVLLLPHGYEGQGSEHSSARISRWLELCAEDNLRVVNCTNAAQFFHVLRRQARLLSLDPRPLIVFSPKSLLRHQRASCGLEQLASGRFMPVIDDGATDGRRDKVARVVLCSGKVYLDLRDSAHYKRAENVAIVRVEELYPFPHQDLTAVLAGYTNAREIVWVQEEPLNMGAWSAISRDLEFIAGSVPVRVVSRPAWASPAEGDSDRHAAEQDRILKDALTVTARQLSARGGR